MTRAVLMESPVGLLLIEGLDQVEKIHMLDEAPSRTDLSPGAFPEAREQLQAYFDGELTKFSLDLAPAGTPFQHLVWTRLRQIPFGETVSYGEVARDIGAPKSSRAVGAATGRNPIGIVVPCHRVVGSSGSLTGYAGGLDRKRTLLSHEAEVLTRRIQAKVPA